MEKPKEYAAPERRSRLKPGLPLLLMLLCGLTAALCLFLYRHDNKYTAPGPDAAYGRMELDSATLKRQGYVWLVDGWEFYGGALLTPEDFCFSSPAPDRYVFAGQLGGFETAGGQPYGSATYRLTVKLPEQIRTYSIYLPEVLSACRLYVNGQERLSLGQISPGHYRTGTAEKILSFEANGQAELLLAVSNYSNSYGGLTYPPALGTPDSIYSMTALRLNLRAALLTMTLLTGLVSLMIWAANRKNPLPALYALFCLLFLGYTCYPVIKTFFPSLYGLYLVENLSFCGMILMVFIIQRKLFSLNHHLDTFGIAFGGFVCLICVAYHLILPRAGLGIMLSYSRLIALYKWLGAALLTANTLRTLRRGSESAPHGKVLLCGMVIFDCTLVMDRLLPLYEPIYSGWFLEISSLCLVLLIGAVILREIYSRSVTNLVLEESIRLTRQNLAMQEEQHQAMMEAIACERTFRHDLRQHISVLHEFADADDIQALKSYFTEMEGRLPEKLAGVFCENAAVDAIIRHYEERAKAAGVEFTAAVQAGSELPISDVDLCVVFGNCLENALEACKRQKDSQNYIRVNAGVSVGVFAITVENSFGGTVQRNGDGFLSSKRPQTGIGTASVQAIARKYGGMASFKTDGTAFCVSVVLHL